MALVPDLRVTGVGPHRDGAIANAVEAAAMFFGSAPFRVSGIGTGAVDEMYTTHDAAGNVIRHVVSFEIPVEFMAGAEAPTS